MDKRVQSLMFTTPVTINKVAAKNSMGDRKVGDQISAMGYIYDDVAVVVNYLGENEVSTRQVYLPMDTIDKIQPSYVVSCLDSSEAHIIRIQTYHGRNSKTMIGVIYLP